MLPVFFALMETFKSGFAPGVHDVLNKKMSTVVDTLRYVGFEISFRASK